MCLIILALDQHPALPLVLAANRDEFHARPALAMDWWSPTQGQPILSGKDLTAGGTWLGINRAGRVAAVTNFRSGIHEAASRSRGDLPLQCLDTDFSIEQRIIELSRNAGQYAGFNLIAGDAQGWYYTSNRDTAPWRRLHRGVYGLSNHLLQTAWPKVCIARESLREALQTTVAQANAQTQHHLHERVLDLLQHAQQAPDSQLPDTGVGLITERMLSPVFIRGAHYGTRVSTVITRDSRGMLRITEQSWHPGQQAGQRLIWQIQT